MSLIKTFKQIFRKLLTNRKRCCNIKSPTRKRYKNLWNGGKVQWEDEISIIIKEYQIFAESMTTSDEKG